MAKALVVYYSVYGNTEKIARALATGVESAGIDVEVTSIDRVAFDKLTQYDLFAVGAPTHTMRIAKPMAEFLDKMKNVNSKGKKGFAFDTKLKFPLAGSAGKGIEKRLKKMGITIVKPHVSVIVQDAKGPLEEGAEEKFKQIGAELARSL